MGIAKNCQWQEFGFKQDFALDLHYILQYKFWIGFGYKKSYITLSGKD